VLVGNLFSVAALSQPGYVRRCLCEKDVEGRTALKRRHLSARACCFFGADAFGAVGSSAASHIDVDVGVGVEVEEVGNWLKAKMCL
jgi:hypothetical protein